MTVLLRALTLICLAGSCFAAPPEINVYAGGVVGLEALARPETSIKFRRAGGGLYLHNDGWARLTSVQQREVLDHFEDQRVAIELGFLESGEAWARRLRTGYLSLGINPTFVAANAFDRDNKPTPEEWETYSKALRTAGLPDSTKIFPTFEYANFGSNLPALNDNTVSKRKDFQDIIKHAGGMVLDTPPAYGFAREENYRAWVVDAIRWTRKQGLSVVWITSPHTSCESFQDDTRKFLDYLLRNDSLPTDIVCENYIRDPPENFSSFVGHEDKPNTILGVAWNLLHTVLPEIAGVPAPPRRRQPDQ